MMALYIRKIKEVVAAETGVSIPEIESTIRERETARARQIVQYLARTEIKPEVSLPWIARQFGQHHTTVLSNCRKVEQLRTEDARFSTIFERCRARLLHGPEGVKELPPPPPTERELRLRALMQTEVVKRTREHDIYKLNEMGMSLREIGLRFGVTRQRIHQIVSERRQ